MKIGWGNLYKTRLTCNGQPVVLVFIAVRRWLRFRLITRREWELIDARRERTTEHRRRYGKGGGWNWYKQSNCVSSPTANLRSTEVR